MARFKNNDLLLKENQKIIFGNSDAYMYWNGVEMVFEGITISGAQGPAGPPGPGIEGNQITNDLDTTTIVCSDDDYITLTTNDTVAARTSSTGGLMLNPGPRLNSEARLEVIENNESSEVSISTFDTGTPTNTSTVYMRRGRGVDNAREIVEAGDVIGNIDFQPVIDFTGQYGTTAKIESIAAGTVSDGIVPTRLNFYTSSGDPDDLENVLTLAANGLVYLKDGVGVDTISNDTTLGDVSDSYLCTQAAIKVYVDNAVATSTASGVDAYRIYDLNNDSTDVTCISDNIRFNINGVERGRFDDNGLFYVASGTGISKISTDGAFLSPDDNSIPTTNAVKWYVDNYGGGGGALAANYIVSGDESASAEINTDSFIISLEGSEYFRIHKKWTELISNRLDIPRIWMGDLDYNESNVVSDSINDIADINIIKDQNNGGARINLYGFGTETYSHPRISFIRASDKSGSFPRHGYVVGELNFGSTASSSSFGGAQIRARLDGNYTGWGGPSTYTLQGYTYLDTELHPGDTYRVLNGVGPDIQPTGLEFWVDNGDPAVNPSYVRGLYITPNGYIKLSHPNSATVNYIIPSSKTPDIVFNTMVPTVQWVKDELEDRLATFTIQSQNVSAISNNPYEAYDVSFNTLVMGHTTLNLNFYEQASIINLDGSDILSGAFWTREDKNYAPSYDKMGYTIFNKQPRRTNFVIENWSGHAVDYRTGGWLTFFRSRGYHPQVKYPIQAGDIIGGITATGVGSENVINLSPCRPSKDYYPDGARIFFRCDDKAKLKPPASIHFQTGPKNNNVSANIGGGGGAPYSDIATRFIIWSKGRIDMYGDYYTDALPATNDTRFNRTYGDVNMVFASKDPAEFGGTLNVMTIGTSEGNGGTICLGGFWRDPKSEIGVPSPPNNITFAKLIGGNDDPDQSRNGGRFSIWTHPSGASQLKEVFRADSRGKISIGNSNLGQGFDATYGRFQINQLNENGDSALACTSPDGNTRARLWAWGGSARLDCSGGNNFITLAGNAGKVCIGGAARGELDAVLQTKGSIAPWSDNLYDLGTPSYRWDDIYATNTTIQVSDKKFKKDIEKSNLGLDFITRLKPVSYRFKKGSRKHYGLIAQDVKKVMEHKGIQSEDFAGYIENNGVLGLRYGEFTAPMIRAIQELYERNKELEKRLKALEGK